MSLTSPIAHRRLLSLGICPPTATTPAEAVRARLAMQAQDLNSALWAVGLRAPPCARADVLDALATGALVRTWPMRGTLHLVAAEDLRWMLALLAPRVIGSFVRRRRQLDLDDEALHQGRALVESIVRDGPVARHDLFARLTEAGFETSKQRGYHLMLYLALRGVVCQGPPAGKQPTFVALDGWVAPAAPVPRDEALRRLAVRYVSGHGPATVHDLSWWSGLTVTDARAAVQLAGDTLITEEIDGVTYLDTPRDIQPHDLTKVHLLPAFDEHLLGYVNRDAALDPAHARRVSPGGGVFRNTVVVGGRVVGTWMHTLRKRTVKLAVELFAPAATLPEPAWTEAVLAYGAFLGLDAKAEVRVV